MLKNIKIINLLKFAVRNKFKFYKFSYSKHNMKCLMKVKFSNAGMASRLPS